MTHLDDIIHYKCGNTIGDMDREQFSTPGDIFEKDITFEPIDSQLNNPDSNQYTNLDETDEYKVIHVILPSEEGCQREMVYYPMQDVYCHPIGQSDSNTFLDSRVYKAE